MNNKEYKAERFFAWLICNLSLQMLLNNFTTALGINTSLDTAFCVVLTLFFGATALPSIIKRLNIKNFIFFAAVATIFLCCRLFYPDYGIPINSGAFFYYTFSYYFVGASVKDSNTALDYLKKYSIVIVLISSVYYIFILANDMEMNEHDMNFAYAFLPCICACLYSAMSSKSFSAKLLAFASIVILLLLGTRGPFICIVLFVFAYYLSDKNYTKTALKFIPLLVVFIFLSVTGIIDTWLSLLNDYFISLGLENRILDKLLSGEFLDDSGRGTLQSAIFHALKDKPAFGYGLYGDRYVTRGIITMKGSYAHNIFLEILCQFGIVFGGIILCSLTWYIVTAFKKCRNRADIVLLLYVLSISVIKLMFSSSYLNDSTFFLLIGLCFAIINRRQYE